MTVFAVFKNGAYRAECGGIFSSEEKAKEAALHLASNDRDDYHSYDVCAFDLDERLPQDPVTSKWTGGGILEPDPIFSCRKQITPTS